VCVCVHRLVSIDRLYSNDSHWTCVVHMTMLNARRIPSISLNIRRRTSNQCHHRHANVFSPTNDRILVIVLQFQIFTQPCRNNNMRSTIIHLLKIDCRVNIVRVTSNSVRAIHCSDKRRVDRMCTVRYDLYSNSRFSKCIVSLMCTFLSCSCARGQVRLNRTERTISHRSINRHNASVRCCHSNEVDIRTMNMSMRCRTSCWRHKILPQRQDQLRSRSPIRLAQHSTCNERTNDNNDSCFLSAFEISQRQCFSSMIQHIYNLIFASSDDQTQEHFVSLGLISI
jgi:hypothetical protein